jgi:hypothetical protein
MLEQRFHGAGVLSSIWMATKEKLRINGRRNLKRKHYDVFNITQEARQVAF